MKLAINFTQQKNLRDVGRWYAAADEAGLDMVGIPDSPALLREVYVSATVAATVTSRIQLMTLVTNPVSRHPSVAASAAMALDELAPGRIAIGIGSGDSALWATRQRAARVATLREYILAMKALWRGEPATFQGETFEQVWPNWEPRDIPVYVACAGPRVLSMACQVADGVVVTMGFSAQDVARIHAVIDEACRQVGRDPSTVELWSNAQVAFADSVEEAMEFSLGWATNWLTEPTLEGKGVPPELHEPLIQLNRDIHDLDAVYKTPNRGVTLVQRAKELGVYDWVLEHSPRLFGRPEDVHERLVELREMGLENWIFLQQSRGTFVGGVDQEKLDLVDKLGRLRRLLG